MAPAPSPICALPISPTYSPTHRYLFYTSLLLSILYPTPPPLVKGAFAFSLTYSATAALYALLLLSDTPISPSTSPTTSTNLDLIALNAILAASALSILPLQTWTSSLSRAARNIIRLWGLLITVGISATFAQLVRARKSALLSLSHEITAANCQSQVAGKLKLRNPLDAVVVDFDRVFGSWYVLVVKHTSVLLFLPLLFGALACLGTVHAAGDAHEYGVDDGMNDYSNTASHATDSGLGATSSTTREMSFRRLYLALRKGMLALTPACWITVVVVNELYLLGGGGLPEMESLREVGQWGVLAGLGFVAAAAQWNQLVGPDETKMGGTENVWGEEAA